MPSRELNRRLWTNYDWRQSGEEWSATWGSTANLWHGTLMPRIGAFLGDIRVVEIGCGHGRLTTYLKDYCSSLVLVDIAANCIEFCRRRFINDAHLEYFVNDGDNLSFLESGTIDFVFSFDSLVHADLQVMTNYLAEIERVLRVGGRAVLHHSNLASVLEQEPASTGAFHMRDREVSADLVLAESAKLETLECLTQELISWDHTARLIDCISSFVRCEQRTVIPITRLANNDFYERAQELKTISESYRSSTKPQG